MKLILTKQDQDKLVLVRFIAFCFITAVGASHAVAYFSQPAPHPGPHLAHPEAKQPFYARTPTTTLQFDLRSEYDKAVENMDPISR